MRTRTNDVLDAINSAHANEGRPGAYISAIAAVALAILALRDRRRVVEFHIVDGERTVYCDDGTAWRWVTTNPTGAEGEWKRAPYRPTKPIPQPE